MILTRIYDFFSAHRKLLTASLTLVTAALLCLVLSLHYSEDILDFLPIGTSENEALSVYRDISGADRIIILFDNPDDSDMTIDAMDAFASCLEEDDSESLSELLVTSFDSNSITDIMSFVYAHIPYFLEENDYGRITELLSEKNFIRDALARDMQVLSMPVSSQIPRMAIINDPLGLFTLAMDRLGSTDERNVFELYDGYIFTPDMKKAIAMLRSPFGNSETSGNSRLVGRLEACAAQVMEQYPDVRIHLTGGPVIAVGNSQRIKKDSIIAISLSAVLIVLLLFFAFNSMRNILLILLSIGWGWLFALGGMAIFRNNVSIIVIGISSVILGIAVNYPLHLVAHTQHQKNIRQAIKEISVPLLVGNITTVGAFLALVPLQSVALRDLGIFASLLLLGTIFFVLVYLPHMVRAENNKPARSRIIPALAAFRPEKYTSIVVATLVLTFVLSFFSLRTSFNSNLSDINYMTAQQREDMQYCQSLLDGAASKGTNELYVISSGDSFGQAVWKASECRSAIDSLHELGLIQARKSASSFLIPEDEQQHRIEMWKAFTQSFAASQLGEFRKEASDVGFSDSAFKAFLDLVQPGRDFPMLSKEEMEPMLSTVLSSNYTCQEAAGKHYVTEILRVKETDRESVLSHLENCYDVAGINRSMADNLSDNFNYIGWACSLIVFFFLWFSFGRIELAIISFMPMAVSWIWILGLMSLLGIQFNIVNVILATFIFGQGDDYTIFMTEGCQFEYAHRRPVLHSYKTGIIQSALIMFVGIGTLIVARHPAMRSLAQVTLVGMTSVVFMAYLIPPFLFRWLTTCKGREREYPLTIASLLCGRPSSPESRVNGRYIYKGIEISRTARTNLKSNAARARELKAEDGCICISDEGYGETAILTALTHPDAMIIATMSDTERMEVACVAADNFVKNIEFKTIQL